MGAPTGLRGWKVRVRRQRPKVVKGEGDREAWLMIRQWSRRVGNRDRFCSHIYISYTLHTSPLAEDVHLNGCKWCHGETRSPSPTSLVNLVTLWSRMIKPIDRLWGRSMKAAKVSFVYNSESSCPGVLGTHVAALCTLLAARPAPHQTHTVSKRNVCVYPGLMDSHFRRFFLETILWGHPLDPNCSPWGAMSALSPSCPQRDLSAVMYHRRSCHGKVSTTITSLVNVGRGDDAVVEPVWVGASFVTGDVVDLSVNRPSAV